MTKTQTHRVLRALHEHDGGITQADFLPPNVIDGGYPITRLAARIRDLRDRGAQIFVDGERHGCAVYRLHVDTSPTLPPPDVVVPERDVDSGALFDMPPRRRGAYEDVA